MKKSKSFKNKLNIVGSLFAIAFLLFSNTYFVAGASSLQTMVFDVNCARPTTSPSQGYVEFLMYDLEDGHFFPYVYFWNTTSFSNTIGETSVNMFVDIHSDSSFTIYPYGATPSDTKAMYTMMSVNQYGKYNSKGFSSSQPFELSFTGEHYIADVRVYGNGYVVDTNWSPSALLTEWKVLYSEDSTAILLQEIYESILGIYDGRSLDDLYDKLAEIEGNTDFLYYMSDISYLLDTVKNQLSSTDSMLQSKLQSIYSRLVYIDKDLKESNTWLQKIFNKIVDLFDKDEDVPLDDIDPFNDKIDSASKEEEEVMDSILDREEIQEQMESDIESMKEQGAVDSKGTWSVFDAIVNSNPKILGMFISVLSIAVIGLIFNRG